MFKQQLLGRLGFFFGISVLVGACVGGQIGDAPGGARLGPGDDFVGQSDPSEPVVPGTPAAPKCAEAGPDVSTSNEWRSSDASLPAFDALYFEFKARPTAANIDGLVGVGAGDINDFDGAALTVRFAQDGLVDVRDGAVYNSDTSYAYDPGVWYTVAVSADITTETYDVEIGPCGEPREKLIEGASFRQESDVSDQLSTWGVWSSQAAELEVSTPTWMASGGCAPATCQSLGSECGEPSDGCNGTLSCGVCGGGQMCSSGVCVDEPVSVPPPPSCTPATCQSLGNQCGAASDGCGGTLNCGGCASGEMCSSGLCVDASVPPPPCVPDTCQSLGTQCGVASDGCGGTLNCGTCTGGDICNASGQCVAPPSSGTPYAHVAPADLGATIGVGVTAAVPTAPYTGPTTPLAGALIEDVVVTGCLDITNDNVTIRNVIIDSSADTCNYPVHVQGASNTLIEYSKLIGAYNDKTVRVQGGPGTIVRNNEITGSCDFFYVQGDLNGMEVRDNVMWKLNASSSCHTDGMQAGVNSTTTGDIVYSGNYIDKDCPSCGANDILFISNSSFLNITVENNFFAPWGWYTLRNGANTSVYARYNVYRQDFKTLLTETGYPAKAYISGATPAEPDSEFRCNRYEDGTFIEQAYVDDLTHDTTGCPSYP